MIKEGTRIESLESDEIIIVKKFLKLQNAYLCEVWNIVYNSDGTYGRNLFGHADYRLLTESDIKRRVSI